MNDRVPAPSPFLATVGPVKVSADGRAATAYCTGCGSLLGVWAGDERAAAVFDTALAHAKEHRPLGSSRRARPTATGPRHGWRPGAGSRRPRRGSPSG